MKLFSTSCETIFLGWDAPLLPRAVETLVQRGRADGELDLSGMICVLPALRSAQRLKALLHEAADREDLRYRPPQVISVGHLAEMLYQPPRPIALEFEQTLAWTHVLQRAEPARLEPLMPNVPPPEPIAPWMEVAGVLRKLHEELAANRLDFGQVCEQTETPSERRRWKLLSELFEHYQQVMQQAGLVDPHLARRHAVESDQVACDRTVVLIGTSDMSSALIAMLRSLSSDLIALIAAPASETDAFDEFGCLQTDAWQHRTLPLRDEQLIKASDIADQAVAVTEVLADYSQQYSADQVTVGVTDESQVGPIEFELRGCGVTPYRHLGWTVSETAVGRLFEVTAAYLGRRTWQTLAALVRHADVARWVSQKLNAPADHWLAELDALLGEFYPRRVLEPLSPAAAKACPLAISVADAVESLLAPFDESEQPIAQWSGRVLQWLEELYPDHHLSGEPDETGEAEMDSSTAACLSETTRGSDNESEGRGHQEAQEALLGQRTAMALIASTRVIRRFAELNDHLDSVVSGGMAIEMIGARLSDSRIVPPRASDQAVQILGWLDLALDDAPAMVVNGLNHPFVPSGVTSDPFLPGEMRSQLAMADNDRRYARDLYAMQLMLSTREDIRFIVGRTGADQSPTPPSRLLAAAEPGDAARRMRQLLTRQRNPVVVSHRWDSGPDQYDLPIPQLPTSVAPEEITTISVTAFRDFLVCPYRYYLRHVLKLRPIDDATSELAANQFGNLVHGALEAFGESDQRDESDVARIESFLLDHLHQFAKHYYGNSVSSAVTLQIAQAERRLKAVAREQAARIAAGWKIYASEAAVDEKLGACIEVNGRKMGLRGRLDRIDFHPDTGRWAILDYKTHGHAPEKKHLKKNGERYEWIDLQLPIYRRMIPFLGIEADPTQVQLGYFNVSEKDEETKINIAEFTSEQFREADRLIERCIERIWAGDFQPTEERVAFDDYDMILQTGVASRLLDQVDYEIEEGGE